MSFHPYHTASSIHQNKQKTESKATESKATESKATESQKSFFKAPTVYHELSRTLSHREVAYELSKVYFDQCKESDTVLSNFFVDRDQIATVEYYKKENGKMVLHRIDAPYTEIKIEWTYQATYFGF